MSEEQPVETAASDRAAPPESLAEALGEPDQLADEIAQTLGSNPSPEEQTVVPMHLEELHGSPGGDGTPRNLDLLADVEIEVTVEFGRSAMPLGRLLQLRRGSLVELARRPEERVTVLANGRPVAYGDIVLVGDHVGVHIVELAEPASPAPAPPPQVGVVEATLDGAGTHHDVRSGTEPGGHIDGGAASVPATDEAAPAATPEGG